MMDTTISKKKCGSYFKTDTTSNFYNASGLIISFILKKIYKYIEAF